MHLHITQVLSLNPFASMKCCTQIPHHTHRDGVCEWVRKNILLSLDMPCGICHESCSWYHTYLLLAMILLLSLMMFPPRFRSFFAFYTCRATLNWIIEFENLHTATIQSVRWAKPSQASAFVLSPSRLHVSHVPYAFCYMWVCMGNDITWFRDFKYTVSHIKPRGRKNFLFVASGFDRVTWV